MSDQYTDFFLNTAPSVYRIETLEISHDDFTRTYYVQKNVTEDVVLTLEDYSDQTFEYYPLRIKPLRSSNDLEAGVEVILGDLGQVIPQEIDAVRAAGGMETKPVVKYREYRSDDLTQPMFGPITLEITSVNRSRDGSSFTAKAQGLNLNRTGERYTFERFPMLRGYV